MATLRPASKEALESRNITPLSEVWIVRYGPNTQVNMVARATENNADFEHGFIGQNGAKNWTPIGSGYSVTDKYRCFGAKCVEISSSGDQYGLVSGNDILGVSSGEPITVSIYYHTLTYFSGSVQLIVQGSNDGSSWINLSTLTFANKKTPDWERVHVTFNSPGSYSLVRFQISTNNFHGHVLIDRVQAEHGSSPTDFVNGPEYVQIVPNVLSYTVEEDRSFGANVLTIQCANPNGDYSYDKKSPVNHIGSVYSPFFEFMNKVILKEGIVGVDGVEEWWTKFTGYVDEQSPINQGGKPTALNIRCTDVMKRLIMDSIDDSFEPEKIYITDHTLVPEDSERLVFKSQDIMNWAKYPPVEIYADGKLLDPGQYTIDYARGKVYFNFPRKEDSITATFYFYKEGTNTLGEVIRRICRKRGFDVGQAFDAEDNYLLGGAENRAKSIDPQYAGEVLLDFYDARINEYIEPQVPPTFLVVEDNVNYLEAIENIKRGIAAPNFVVKADPHGVIRGFYSYQKTSYDHELVLPMSINAPISDGDIYTRVVVYGRSGDNNGLIRFATVQKHYNAPYEEGKPEDVMDGNVDTYFCQHWGDGDWEGRNLRPPVQVEKNGRTTQNFPFLTFDFGKNISELVAEKFDITDFKGVGEIHIEGCNPHNWEIYSAGRVGSDTMEFALKCRRDGEDSWFFPSEKAMRFRLPKNQLVVFDQADFEREIRTGLDFRWLRLEVVHMSHYIADARTGKKGKGYIQRDAWCIGIGGIQIWPSAKIVGEARASQELIDKLGLRTWVVPEDPMIDTKEKAQRLAELILAEKSRNLRRISTSVVFAPFIELGDTVLVVDPVLGINRLFYVESIRRVRNGLVPTTTLGMVAYDSL